MPRKDGRITDAPIPIHLRHHLEVGVGHERATSLVDNVLGRRAMPPTYRDVDRYVDSIQRLRALEPSAIHTSHLGSFTDDAVIDVLDRSVRHVERFEHHLLDALTMRGPASLRELAEHLMPRIGPWPAPLATLRDALAAHIDQIVARGLATVETHRGLSRYRIAS